jgi:hypothetical protein
MILRIASAWEPIFSPNRKASSASHVLTGRVTLFLAVGSCSIYDSLLARRTNLVQVVYLVLTQPVRVVHDSADALLGKDQRPTLKSRLAQI